MTWQAVATLGVVGGVLVTLAASRVRPHFVLVGALTVLLGLSIVTEAEVLSGLSNPGMATVGVLFAVAAGIRETGALDWVGSRLFSSAAGGRIRRTLFVTPVAFMSAFMNNIPLVAMMLPVVSDWARKRRISPSELLIPLSYASILGGTCTLIGTSTVIVVDGLLASELGPEHALGMFDIAAVGVPCAAAGLLYLSVVAPWLLRDRKPATGVRDDPREYTVEMLVPPKSPLAGKSIEQAGLRHLPEVYLMEIHRGPQVMTAVAPDVVLAEEDRLVFVGVIGSVVDLQRLRGLIPATDQVTKLGVPTTARRLVEVVVSNSCPVVGQTVREGRFRSRYGAAVIAVARNGQRLTQKIGDIVLKPGDTLLLAAPPTFASRFRDSRDFYLVSSMGDTPAMNHDRAWIAIGILAAMVLTVAAGLSSMFTAALLAAGAMVLAGCCSASSAMRSVEWPVLVVIAAAFGLGKAMESSGAAGAIAEALLASYGATPTGALAVLTAATMAFTNVINANAAAVLVFPVAMDTAAHLGVNPMPFAIGVIMGAAGSFMTPIGYQTNLMVYGPGGYRFMDYVRVGAPLSFVVVAISVVTIPMVWPF